MLRSGLAILGAAAVCASGLAATSQKRPTPARKICGRGIAGERPAWSPRGSQIAFVKHRPYGIWMTTPDGRRIRRLKSSATFIGSVAWSPDGTKLAYDLATPQPGGEVHVMNADGSNDHPVGPGYAPSFSPDGTRLALLQPGAGWSSGLLDVMKVDGTERRTLARNVAAYSPPAWSPDGKTIAYGGPAVPASFENWITLVSSADGTVIRTAGEGVDMRWSATNLIAYTAGLDDGSEVDLVRPSGAGRRTLALDLYQRYDFSPQVGRDDQQPSWSPNGKHLVFVANEKPR